MVGYNKGGCTTTSTLLFLPVCRSVSYMRSEKWPRHPWVLVAQWTEHLGSWVQFPSGIFFFVPRSCFVDYSSLSQNDYCSVRTPSHALGCKLHSCNSPKGIVTWSKLGGNMNVNTLSITNMYEEGGVKIMAMIYYYNFIASLYWSMVRLIIFFLFFFATVKEQRKHTNKTSYNNSQSSSLKKQNTWSQLFLKPWEQCWLNSPTLFLSCEKDLI